MEKRKQRKLQHLDLFIKLFDNNRPDVFQNYSFVHNSLPELSLSDIDLGTYLFNNKLKINSPFIINAITGGIEQGKEINRALASAAKELGIPMAVGSQYVALRDTSIIDTFKVVREENPKGIIFANSGAMVSLQSAQTIVDMIEANALQIHLNIPQEVVMDEGDRSFKGYLFNIEQIVKRLEVPVIVKEVGFGISGKVARKLADIGVSGIDIGGKGGTNFIEIEQERSRNTIGNLFKDWGIPTGISLVECIKSVPEHVDIIASGGIRDGLNTAKALALGAKCVGIAGLFLYILLTKGQNELINTIKKLEKELKLTMLMLGAKNPRELTRCPVVITGKSKEWLELRGYDISFFAKR